MDAQIRDLIRKRAEEVLVFSRDYLMHRDESSYEVGEAFKFAVLIVAGPKRFLEQFRNAPLTIDSEAVKAIYWDLRGQIDGPGGLLHEELVVIRDHNIEAENLKPTSLRVVRGLASGS